MTNNIKKAFKTKSKLRCMADGGHVDPRILGSGMAQRAGSALQGRRAQLEAAIDAASGAPPPPAPVAADRAKKPEEKSTLRSFFGLADGGKVKGKGGPTDDKVGPVMLSDGEYVLPADTVKIVGRDKLDALRLATHDFVDDRNKPKVSSLRKMADGGVFYVDPEGVASRQMSPGRAVVPYQPPSAPSAPAVPTRPSIGSRLRSATGRGLAGLGGIYAVSDGVRSMANEGVTATNVGDTASGLTLLAQAAGRANPVAAAAGTGWALGRAIGDNLSIDAQDAIGSTINNIVRGTGQTINKGLRTIGFDTDFGSDWGVDDSRYLESKASAGGAPATPVQSRPSEFPGMSNVPAGVRTSSAGVPATPVQPQSYQSRRLAEMGVPVDQQNLAPVTEDTRRSLLREGSGTPGQYVNLGSYGGDANIYGTASKPGGRIDTFTGVGASARPGGSGPQEDLIMSEIRSALRGLTNRDAGGGAPLDIGSAREINARYDRLLRSGVGRNVVRGLDWSQRHGLDVERARANELGELARNQAALRGQDMQASTAANKANLQARAQALQTLGTLANQRDRQIAAAQAAQLKAQTDLLKELQSAQKTAEERDERGLTDIREAIRARFGDDSALAESVLSRILSAGEGQIGRVTSLTGQDRAAAIEDLIDSAVLATQFDAAQNPLWGDIDTGLPRVTEVRDPRFFRDIASGAAVLPAFGREVKDFFGFDGRVMVDEDGRVAPLPGDLRLRRTIRRAEADAPRRSRLRNDE
jgi:hypothetical protein